MLLLARRRGPTVKVIHVHDVLACLRFHVFLRHLVRDQGRVHLVLLGCETGGVAVLLRLLEDCFLLELLV